MAKEIEPVDEVIEGEITEPVDESDEIELVNEPDTITAVDEPAEIEPTDEHIETEPLDEHEDADEEHSVSFAARSLQILALLSVGVAIGLWAGPRVAPHLPQGLAPLAAWLSPQTNASVEALEALRAENNVRLAVLEAGVQRPEIEARLANFQTDIVNPLRDQMKALTDQMAASNTTAIETRLWAVEGKVEGLIAEFDSLRTLIGSVAEEGGSISADTAASIAAYRTRIDALQAQVDEITGRQGELTRVITEAQSSISARVEEAEQLVEVASETALSAQNKAALASAITEIETTLQTGGTFGDAVATIAEISGQPAPDALGAGAVASREALEQSFPLLAHAAIRADIAATPADGGLSGIGAFFRAQVATRSLTPQEGMGVDAVLSRMDAALKQGALDTVLGESEDLSAAAMSEMAGWLADVKARAGAIDAFNTWRAAVQAGE